MRIGLRLAAMKQRVIRYIALNRAGAGVNQQLRRIKTVSLLRGPGTMYPTSKSARA